MVNKNILKIRKKLDQLDNYFLNLVKKRTLLVDKVLKNKKHKKDIVDKKRIKIILKNINKKSRHKNIDPKIEYAVKATIYFFFSKFKGINLNNLKFREK